MDEISKPWTFDVQRGLAWTIVLVFSLLLIALLLRVVVSGAPTDSLELLKQGVNALINILMVVIGFFFGSSKSSQVKDETANKVAEKLAENVVSTARGEHPQVTTVTTVPTEPATTPTTTTVTTTEEPKP